MKTRNTILTLLLAGFLCNPSFSQIITLSGKVSDKNTSEPLTGVSVSLKGTKSGTVTDANGDFRLPISVSLPVTLIFTSVNHTMEEIAVSGNEQLFVQLTPASI